MEYDASIRIREDLDKIDNYEISSEGIKRFRETVAKIEKVIADSFNVQTTKQSFEMLNKVVKDSYKPIFEQYEYEKMLKDIRFVIDEMADAMDFRQLEILKNIDFSRIYRDSFYSEKYAEASQRAYEYAEEEVKGEENISQEELLEIFNEQIGRKIGWQEKLYNKSEEFKRRYFVFYNIFVACLCFIISEIMSFFAQLGIAYAFGNITSEPQKDAPVIYYFDQRTEVNIIGETDYYYFITYPDNDGNESVGYCEKENVEIIPEDNNENEKEAE
ncbi:hypothetical protein D7X88_04005 [bacterium C-53]|nr:hypothetical protein [Lachnospiraceae bacterium]NBI02396.1 hypothetical protein [Lachnospiraceae bacterium]RKJ11946.1 hypothetical protein D7X88_04005 [bacterium C-53]